MKTIINKIISFILALGLIIGAFEIYNRYIEPKTQTQFKVTNVLYESTNDFYLENGDMGIEFSDGSYAIANLETNEYTFQPAALGDWDYSFNNLQDFENCIKTYASIQNTGSY